MRICILVEMHGCAYIHFSAFLSCFVKILAKCGRLWYTVFMMLDKFSQKRICVAVSGGMDSVSLLHYLHSQREKYGYLLLAVHCEHGIRGEASLADMCFVQGLCKKLGVKLFVFQEDCVAKSKREKESLETAARNFRYECFESLVKGGETDYIATAHHQLDEVETVLFRLARGTSLSGVKGMVREKGWLIRPFLEWSKAEIEKYAEENHLDYCIDETNADLQYTRNKLRAEVLPKLEEAMPAAGKNIARFAAVAAEDDALLYELAGGLLEEKKDGYFVKFSEKKPLATRACLMAIKGLGVEKDYTSEHLDALYALQKSERGAKLDLPKNVECIREEKGLFFRVKQKEKYLEKPMEKPFALDGFDGGRYEVILSKEPIFASKDEWQILRADLDKFPKNAIFRFRKEGEEMQVFGGGTKSLKKLFNERKIPVGEREWLPMIAEGDCVYAVCGVEISERVKVDETTRRQIYIYLRKKNGE